MDILNQLESLDKTITKRLSLRGVRKDFDVYRVPIESLKYNIKNDRVATFVTQYIDEDGDLPDSTAEFNKIIEKFIVESNPDAFSKTKSNIKALGQIEPAVVMSDGIVIDGNRRFTALRQLNREGHNQFGYLEAVVLNRDTYTDKDIKRLELNLQHAIESRVDYNPIERLVGIYRDLIQEGHPFSIEEYSVETQIPIRKIKEEVEISTLLVEYLVSINQPEKFHIARKQKVDGPLREVHKILKAKEIDEYEKEDVKEFLFANILSLGGDITRKIRDLKSVLQNEKTRELILEESSDILDDMQDALSEEEVLKEATETGIINIPRGTRNELLEITERYVDNDKLSKAKDQPIQSLKLSKDKLEQVDKEAVRRFDENRMNQFSEYIRDIEDLIIELKELTNA